MDIRPLALLLFALTAFAANSILCRLALAEQTIDAGSFTTLRLLSGSIMLWILVEIKQRKRVSPAPPDSHANWRGALYLFIYCAGFSFAYLALDTGMGALILFGTVQLVIIGASIVNREHTSWRTWLGVLCALVGFVYLVAPSSFPGFHQSRAYLMLMIAAGFGWARYTLLGRQSQTPLLDTAIHFRRALWFCIPFMLCYSVLMPITLSVDGIILSVLSGAVTSGLGYAVWYQVLPKISRVQAGVVQLSVPVVAALGGVVLLSESLTLHFVVASALLLIGIFITLLPRKKKQLM